jgi:hypothetical protein
LYKVCRRGFWFSGWEDDDIFANDQGWVFKLEPGMILLEDAWPWDRPRVGDASQDPIVFVLAHKVLIKLPMSIHAQVYGWVNLK